MMIAVEQIAVGKVRADDAGDEEDRPLGASRVVRKRHFGERRADERMREVFH